MLLDPGAGIQSPGMSDPVLGPSTKDQLAVFTNAFNACGQSMFEQLFGVLDLHVLVLTRPLCWALRMTSSLAG